MIKLFVDQSGVSALSAGCVSVVDFKWHISFETKITILREERRIHCAKDNRFFFPNLCFVRLA